MAIRPQPPPCQKKGLDRLLRFLSHPSLSSLDIWSVRFRLGIRHLIVQLATICSMLHFSPHRIGFFGLSAEIRIAISELVALQRTRPAGQALYFCSSGEPLQIARFSTSGLPVFNCSRSQRQGTIFPTAFKDLRLCSHQIYAETKQYVSTVPPIYLTILGNSLLTYCSSQ